MIRLFVLVFVSIFASVTAAAPPSGSTTWNDWSFSWNVGANFEGLEVSNVTWKGVKVLHKGSMPVIRVQYANNACGPYPDRIGLGSMVSTACQPGDKICLREWTGGNPLLEIGAYAKLGGYDIYQAWYFTRSGWLEAAMWSKGWHCNISHRHHAYWRLDFDIESIANQVWRFHTSGGNTVWQQYNTERDQSVAGLSGVGWWIQNTSGSRFVQLRPWNTEVPDGFAPHDASVRLYRSDENVGWPWGASSQLLFNNGEQLWNRDYVFWWIGHLSHNWDGTDPQGAHWHWVGPAVYMNW